MSAANALALLANPDNIVQNTVRINEDWNTRELFAFLSEQTGIPVADFEAAAADQAALGIPEWGQGKPGGSEGFFFPDTYNIGQQPTAASILKQMVTQFNVVTTELDFVNRAAAIGQDPYSVLIVASIVQKEGAYEAYAADIADVFYNRLAINMPLQSDATVIYANKAEGRIATSLEQRQCTVPDSDQEFCKAYNTYITPGLPAGPIGNPARLALSAAANPNPNDYLFFVAVNPNSGETKFATDDAGHKANVDEWMAWCELPENEGKCSV
jgi:UPF0755 protein